jgi:spermidine synthase
MKPWKVLAKDGNFSLRQRNDEFMIQVEGKILMTSRRHGSEEELARIGCARTIVTDRPQVLVGGLGFGFTLGAALEFLPHNAKVIVSELSQSVVEWNKTVLAEFTKNALEDPRVQIELGDIHALLAKKPQQFDAILLDIDNGPFGLSLANNQTMYGLGGLSLLRSALAPGGRLAIWSASNQGGFVKRMEEVGMKGNAVKTSDGKHLIFTGDVKRRSGP